MRSQILRVFMEETATPLMMKHCLTVTLKAYEYTNPGEVPWVTADQPLFCTCQNNSVVFSGHSVGALYIEKASLTFVAQVEDGSGTLSPMADANITTIGIA